MSFEAKFENYILHFGKLLLNDAWVGNVYMIARRSLFSEASIRRLTKNARTVGNLPAKLPLRAGGQSLMRDCTVRVESVRVRAYVSADAKSVAFVGADIDAILQALDIDTLYCSVQMGVVPWVTTPLADAPRANKARVFLAPYHSRSLYDEWLKLRNVATS